MELYDAVHWAVHIVHSETVAVNDCNIWGDQLIPNSGGIVIDGSRRVYLGGNIISTADNAITVKTTSGVTITGSWTCLPRPHCAAEESSIMSSPRRMSAPDSIRYHHCQCHAV